MLYWNFAIPRHRLTANVAHGVVMPRGLVEWPCQMSYAAYAAARVRRVSGVTGPRERHLRSNHGVWMADNRLV